MRGKKARSLFSASAGIVHQLVQSGERLLEKEREEVGNHECRNQMAEEDVHLVNLKRKKVKLES